MAYRKYLSRNPEENLHLLEQQILLGEIEAVEPYVLMLNRIGMLDSKNLPLDLEICKSSLCQKFDARKFGSNI